jgi:hypothetical protein
VHPHLFDAMGDRLDEAKRALEEALDDRYKQA